MAMVRALIALVLACIASVASLVIADFSFSLLPLIVLPILLPILWATLGVPDSFLKLPKNPVPNSPIALTPLIVPNTAKNGSMGLKALARLINALVKFNTILVIA